MDKQQNSKPKSNSNSNNILKMLPKAMSFGQSLAPFSPGRDLHHHHQTTSTSNKSFFSGPIVRLVPVEARFRRTKNDDVLNEPTSPKVSCIGQIKLAKTKCSEKKKEKKKKNTASPPLPKPTSSHSKEEGKARPSMIKRMFSSAGAKPPEKTRPTTATAAADIAGDRPSLGQMKKFASSRDALADFDWTEEMNRREEFTAEDPRREYFSDDEKTRVKAWSAPLSLNGREGLKPKNEVNLWKRRTMNPPRPLQIKDD